MKVDITLSICSKLKKSLYVQKHVELILYLHRNKYNIPIDIR